MTRKQSHGAFAMGFKIPSYSALMKPCKVQKGVCGFQITGTLYN